MALTHTQHLQDSELFEFCLTQLKSHLSSEKTKGKLAAANWGDQLEYSLILMDLFYQMMRETQLFSKKLVLLTRNSGQLLLSLAVTVAHSMPPPMSNDSEVSRGLGWWYSKQNLRNGRRVWFGWSLWSHQSLWINSPHSHIKEVLY